MIRRAAFADIPAMAGLLAEAHARSIYARTTTLDIPHVKTLLLQAVQADGGAGLGGTLARVAEHDGRVSGLFVAVRERVHDLCTSDTLRARDLFYVNQGNPRDGVRLLDAFLDWARHDPQVIEVIASFTDTVSDSARVARLYERRGFSRHGLIYRKELTP